jgi:serine/threonine protein kinase
MGIVYRVHDTRLKRAAALKALPAHLTSDKTYVERFLREARACARLDHPNVVQVYRTGTHEGTPYIAMEFVQGRTVDEVLKRGGPLDWNKAIHIIRQAALGLEAAHGAALIHRDIKPQNLMVSAKGHVKVLDFGLAKTLDAAVKLTLADSTLGTPRYMSPEQCTNKAVGPRTDLYSLGVVLFEMLTGQPPHDAPTPLALMYQIANDDLPPLKQFNCAAPPGVEQLVIAMVAKTPDDRPESAGFVAATCAALLASGGEAIAAAEALAPITLDDLEGARPSESTEPTRTFKDSALTLLSAFRARSTFLMKVIITVMAPLIAMLAWSYAPWRIESTDTIVDLPLAQWTASFPVESVRDQNVEFTGDHLAVRFTDNSLPNPEHHYQAPTIAFDNCLFSADTYSILVLDTEVAPAGPNRHILELSFGKRWGFSKGDRIELKIPLTSTHGIHTIDLADALDPKGKHTDWSGAIFDLRLDILGTGKLAVDANAEIRFHSIRLLQAELDEDGDGNTNALEARIGTDPFEPDPAVKVALDSEVIFPLSDWTIDPDPNYRGGDSITVQMQAEHLSIRYRDQTPFAPEMTNIFTYNLHEYPIMSFDWELIPPAPANLPIRVAVRPVVGGETSAFNFGTDMSKPRHRVAIDARARQLLQRRNGRVINDWTGPATRIVVRPGRPSNKETLTGKELRIYDVRALTAKGDADGDGILNEDEAALGTDPLTADVPNP